MSGTLLVVAHPDDEVLGAGILMSRASPGAFHILHLTNGSPADGKQAREAGFADSQSYARARSEELRNALDLLGIPRTHCHRLDLPDQESHRHIKDIVAAITSLLAQFQSVELMTHALEGGHPDHDTAAFAAAYVKRVHAPGLKITEFPLYHAGTEGQMITGCFADGDESDVTTLVPTAQEIDLKRKMMACFQTQAEMLSSFAAGPELFRPAPAYELDRLKKRPALYEYRGWPLSRIEWIAAMAEYR